MQIYMTGQISACQIMQLLNLLSRTQYTVNNNNMDTTTIVSQRPSQQSSHIVKVGVTTITTGSITAHGGSTSIS